MDEVRSSDQTQSGRARPARKPSGLIGSETLATLTAAAASAKKAEDIVIMDVSQVLGIADYFVICSGSNERQVRTIASEVERALSKKGVKVYRREGEREALWVLLDYLDVVVHVFETQQRAFYDLERLWKDAPRVPFDDNVAATHV